MRQKTIVSRCISGLHTFWGGLIPVDTWFSGKAKSQNSCHDGHDQSQNTQVVVVLRKFNMPDKLAMKHIIFLLIQLLFCSMVSTADDNLREMSLGQETKCKTEVRPEPQNWAPFLHFKIVKNTLVVISEKANEWWWEKQTHTNKTSICTIHIKTKQKYVCIKNQILLMHTMSFYHNIKKNSSSSP